MGKQISHNVLLLADFFFLMVPTERVLDTPFKLAIREKLQQYLLRITNEIDFNNF